MQTTQIKNLLWIGTVAIALSLVFNFMFFEEGLGLNFPLFILFVLIAGWILINTFKIKSVDVATIILSVLILFFSMMVFIRSSLLLTFFNVLGTLLLLLIIVNSYLGKNVKEYLPLDYLKIFTLPLFFIPVFFKKISEFVSLGNYSPATKEIIRGLIMTLITLVIFTGLFASADAIFGKVVEYLFSFEVNDEFVGRLIIFVFVAAFFLGAFGYMFNRFAQEFNSVVRGRFSMGVIETKMLLISINILFFIFIVFQLTYLFGGESQVLSQGLTYAEYARKGFFELLWVAFLSYLIISVAESLIVKKENKHLLFFKVLSSILIFQVLVILVSAFVRLSLYEDAYGFSTIRLYSHSLMIWVGVVLVLLAYYIIRNGKPEKFALKVFYSVVFLLLSMNLLNPDAFIAKRNMERYRETGKIDVMYLTTLSYDALPYTISLLNDPNENIRKLFAHGLYWSNTVYNPDVESARNWVMDIDSWKSQKLMRSKAHTLLNPHKNIMEENKIISEELKIREYVKDPL